MQTIIGQPLQHPLGLLAELTHRCPLGCPYCSNPVALGFKRRRDTSACSRSIFGRRADGAA